MVFKEVVLTEAEKRKLVELRKVAETGGCGGTNSRCTCTE